VALISIGNSDGNKLKCAPKILKIPPFYYPSVIPTEITVGNCAAGNAVGNSAFDRRALWDV
jgi:hypothetical protein